MGVEGVNFDRRMEASVGKSPEGEQLLMTSNRSPNQDFISVVVSFFPFLSFLIFTHHLITFFLPHSLFYLLCSSPFIPLFFSFCNYLLILYLYSFLCVQLSSFVTLFFLPLIFIITSLLVCFSPPPCSLFYCFLSTLLISSAVFSYPLLSFSFLLFPCSVQDPLNSVLSFYKFNFFAQIHFFSF